MRLRRRACLLPVLLAPMLLGVTPAVAAAQRATKVQTVRFSTVPVTKGLQLRFSGGQSARTNSRGIATIRLRLVRHPGGNTEGYRHLKGGYYYRMFKVRPLRRRNGSVVRFDRIYGRALIAVTKNYRFVPRFIGQGGRPCREAPSRATRSRAGRAPCDESRAHPPPCFGACASCRSGRFVTNWAIQSVIVDGTNVVTRASNRFSPRKLRGPFKVSLLFVSAKVTSTDALFGSHLGESVSLTYPSGRKREIRFSKDGTIALTGLPRGAFKIKVNAHGVSPERPIALSRNQVIELTVISYLDLALAGGLLGAIAITLLVLRRPHLRRLPRGRAERAEQVAT